MKSFVSDGTAKPIENIHETGSNGIFEVTNRIAADKRKTKRKIRPSISIGDSFGTIGALGAGLSSSTLGAQILILISSSGSEEALTTR
jgi:hypothetical protein